MSTLERKDLVADIVEQINAVAQNEESRIEDGDAGSYREYVESFGYGEIDLTGLVREARISDEAKAALLKLKKEDLKDALSTYCRFAVGTIYIEQGEIFSLIIGEVEVQLSEDLAELAETLSEEERRGLAYYYSKGFIYLDHNYTRYLMLFDEDAFFEDREPEPEDDDRTETLKTALGKITLLSQELNKLNAPKAERPALRVVEGQGLDWADLVTYRIRKSLNNKRSSAKLKLVS